MAPFDYQLENGLIGGILINNEAILDVCSGLKAVDFQCPENQIIWRELERALISGLLANPVTLREPLEPFIENPSVELFGRAAHGLSVVDSDFYATSAVMVKTYYPLNRQESRYVMEKRFPHLAKREAV